MRMTIAAAVAVAVLMATGCQDQQARDQNAKLQAELDLLKAQKPSGGNDDLISILAKDRVGQVVKVIIGRIVERAAKLAPPGDVLHQALAGQLADAMVVPIEDEQLATWVHEHVLRQRQLSLQCVPTVA